MQRRYSRFGTGRPVPSDSILLYGFGLALVLSLVFNGFLLYEQSHYRPMHDYDAGYPVDQADWQQPLSDRQPANQQKDSRTVGLADSAAGPGTQRTAGTGQRRSAPRFEPGSAKIETDSFSSQLK